MSRLNKAPSVGKAFQEIMPPPIVTNISPAATNFKHPLGQIWCNNLLGLSFILAKKAAGVATWNELAPGAVVGQDTSIAGNLILTSVATQVQMNGGAVTDFIGQGTLVAGTVTIANTNIAAGDRIFVTRSALNASPALGDFITTISAAASFTVASYDALGAVETTDVSSFDYFIVRQN